MTHQQIVIGLGVLAALGALTVWRSGRKSAKKAKNAARDGARVVGMAGRVLVFAALITAVQWGVIRFVHNNTLVWVVLALPGLFAASALVRATTVTVSTHRGGHR